ncbi:ComEC/Rec2 family competence protein [Campylobacter curvus]|uniref:ComEC/Rec2 family competence protein n=1 Tax=Campylobacter curvus TaxID=200 RepID=UPI0014703B98|nr:ComEC/Rec2 family competence protein [Campylobacter curvus]
MPLFTRRVHYIFFALFCLALLGLNLAVYYAKFQNFMDKGEQELVAKVELDYVKTNEKGKKYRILRLDTGEFKFYTVAAKSDEFRVGDRISLVVQNIDVSFKDYLSGMFYMRSSEREILNESTSEPDALPLRDKILNFIQNQHENAKISQLYSALFLATAVSGELRDDVAHWGVAHLVAISGYHLGVIVSALFLLAAPLYMVLCARFFPFRSYKFDISLLAFGVLAFYFYLIGFVPSFLRAFAMSVFGFYMLCCGIKILSFPTLFIVICFCVAMFPSLALNVGFYFSCAGVFYIFLYLHYFKDKFSLLTHSLLLNLYVFFAMEVIVLYFFPLISLQQFGVIPLSYVFTLFYPLSALLHALNLGSIFDEWLVKFLNFRLASTQLHIPLALFLSYNLISLLAVRFKILVLLPPIIGAGCFVVAIFDLY